MQSYTYTPNARGSRERSNAAYGTVRPRVASEGLHFDQCANDLPGQDAIADIVDRRDAEPLQPNDEALVIEAQLIP